jgi:geranylgeranyl pyrophosphate synthase
MFRADLWVLLGQAREDLERTVNRSGLPADLNRRILARLEHDHRLLDSEESAGIALLLLLCQESAAGGGKVRPATGASTAMQLLLAAGDLLDDVQDGDYEWEGRHSSEPTETVAALLALAHGALATTEGVPPDRLANALRLFARYELMALGGQSADARQCDNRPSSPSEAVAATRRKSGFVGRCAAEVGAALGTDDPQLISLHGQFGELLSTIHQLMNDISGVWPGGPHSNDIQLNRRTVPTVVIGRLIEGGNLTVAGFDEVVRGAQVNEETIRSLALGSGAIHVAWGVAAVIKFRAARIAGKIAASHPSSRIGGLLMA